MNKAQYQIYREKKIKELGGVEAFDVWRKRNSSKGGSVERPRTFALDRKLAKRAGRIGGKASWKNGSSE